MKWSTFLVIQKEKCIALCKLFMPNPFVQNVRKKIKKEKKKKCDRSARLSIKRSTGASSIKTKGLWTLVAPFLKAKVNFCISCFVLQKSKKIHTINFLTNKTGLQPLCVQGSMFAFQLKIRLMSWLVLMIGMHYKSLWAHVKCI